MLQKFCRLNRSARYNRDGYIAPVRIFSDSEIRSIRSYFDDLLNRVMSAGGDSYSISSAHLKYGPVYDILTDKRIIDVVSDLLGENVIAWVHISSARCLAMVKPLRGIKMQATGHCRLRRH